MYNLNSNGSYDSYIIKLSQNELCDNGIDDDGDNLFLSDDGIDNDGDGEIDEENEGIDEPDEFNSQKPKFDDQPFLSIEGLKAIKGIGEGKYEKLKN